jgi:polysaccharide biosynthesis protein PslH
MKVLLLAHRLPYPLESGQHLRLYHLARQLAERHEVRLIAFGAPPYPAALDPVFSRIDTRPIPRVRAPGLTPARLREAFAVDQIVPVDPQMAALIRQTLTEWRPDAVWVGGWDMLVYASEVRPVRLVADAVDEGFLEASRELRRARRPGHILRSVKTLVNWVRWERRYFPQADVCLFTSGLDARWAARVVPRLPTAVVENGVDTEFFRPLDGPEDHPSLVFEGNQSFPPNVDAALHLVRDILPRVRQRVPSCRAYLVGRDPPRATQRLASDHVVVTGRVEDVRPYVDQATVFVCPMRTGAGIKNKILQAWAMGKPVVATPTAVGGLHASPGRDIVVARSGAAFAEAVVGLIGNPLARRDLGKRARDLVLQHYSWAQHAGALERALRG